MSGCSCHADCLGLLVACTGWLPALSVCRAPAPNIIIGLVLCPLFFPQVILSFTSNWTPTGGVDQFANLTGGSHNDFFSKDAPKALFKDFVR